MACSELPAPREVAADLTIVAPPTDPAALACAPGAADSGDSDRDGVVARRARAARYIWRACANATTGAYRKALD
ncbi:MAG TPA: hypothetical protein VJ757_07530 [Pseudonocardiaceae bacterium]|nr:hypothetical protein [Pseudonocardiaceae bacterium]